MEIQTPEKTRLSTNAKIVLLVALVTLAVALGFFTRVPPKHTFTVQFMGKDGRAYSGVVGYEVIMEQSFNEVLICSGHTSEQGAGPCGWATKLGDKVTVKIEVTSPRLKLVSELMHYPVKPGDVLQVYLQPKP